MPVLVLAPQVELKLTQERQACQYTRGQLDCHATCVGESLVALRCQFTCVRASPSVKLHKSWYSIPSTHSVWRRPDLTSTHTLQLPNNIKTDAPEPPTMPPPKQSDFDSRDEFAVYGMRASDGMLKPGVARF